MADPASRCHTAIGSRNSGERPLAGRSEANARVQQVLAANGLTVQIRTFPESTRSAGDAAGVLGCDISQIAKSIVFRRRDDGSPVLVIASGRNRVDEGLIRSALGADIEQADPEFVREATGFAIGGVAPIGHPRSIPTFVDADLMAFETVWAAAGTPRSVLALRPAELVRVTAGRVMAITSSGV